MKWCPHCRKYVQTRVEKTEIRAVKWTRLVYHCSECNGFIESRQLNKRAQKTKDLRKERQQ